MKTRLMVLAALSLILPAGFSQTIADKMASGSAKAGESEMNMDTLLREVNKNLVSLRQDLDTCYSQVDHLKQTDAKEEEYFELLKRVNAIKEEMLGLENRWRSASVEDSKRDEEGYALWDQEETTLNQLVMEFGSLDYLYVIPPELLTTKLNMHSNIPIPRESWSDVLEIILAHNGIGVKNVNTYARQLFLLKQDPSAVRHIASSPEDLHWIADHARLFYVFSPPVEQVKSTFQFFERFADTKQTFIYQVGPKIAIVSSKDEVQKLLDLYRSVWSDGKGKVSRVVSINKMAVKEMEKILQAFFGEALEKSRPPFGKADQEGLNIFSLGHGNSLILIGQEDVVARAEKIVHDTEEQMQDPAEMTVHLYQCRHSNPDDLAKVLEKVYNSLVFAATDTGRENIDLNFQSQGAQFKTPDGYAPTPPLVVAPTPLKSANTAALEANESRNNDHFIPDPKTGNILMVIRRDVLAKVKELLRKLDVPKKMVQIEVLLFEKRYNNQNSYGLNLLKLGSKKNGVRYEDAHAPHGNGGVLQFLLHGHSSKHFPAYDLAYSFLMTQEDIQLNAAPSVITVNQTPCMISIVEEISINNGAAPIDTNKGIAFEKSFTRSQYGITLKITPTVNLTDSPDEMTGEVKGFVTLQTDLAFDTPRKEHQNDQPLVHRRQIQNEVRVVDGQTIILGGLRRKQSTDKEQKVPFLGEIPGVGKLFGATQLTNDSTEMFIFITPTIILDPEEELIQVRTEELKKRPGDIPEFLNQLVEARKKERNKFFVQSMEMFFGGKS